MEKPVLSGIADEASEDLRDQIEVHRELGWKTIELRNIDGQNITQIDEDGFNRTCELIEGEGMRVLSFASAIANWARPITSDFSRDLEDLRRAAPRMRRLGTEFIRVMSYPNDGLKEEVWQAEVLRRLGELARIAEGEGVILLHENCDGWASESPANLKYLIERIDSPALQIVFDSGNPVAHGSSGEETWEFYLAAKPYIRHFHIKDCRRDQQGNAVHTFPGEGWCRVQEIIRDLLKNGYDGAFSIEPHMAVQIHMQDGAPAQDEARTLYLEYGRRAGILLQNFFDG